MPTRAEIGFANTALAATATSARGPGPVRRWCIRPTNRATTPAEEFQLELAQADGNFPCSAERRQCSRVQLENLRLRVVPVEKMDEQLIDVVTA